MNMLFTTAAAVVLAAQPAETAQLEPQIEVRSGGLVLVDDTGRFGDCANEHLLFKTEEEAKVISAILADVLGEQTTARVEEIIFENYPYHIAVVEGCT